MYCLLFLMKTMFVPASIIAIQLLQFILLVATSHTRPVYPSTITISAVVLKGKFPIDHRLLESIHGTARWESEDVT